MLATIFGICGAMRGACAMIVASTSFSLVYSRLYRPVTLMRVEARRSIGRRDLADDGDELRPGERLTGERPACAAGDERRDVAFGELHRVGLLGELVLLVHQRPDITTGALLEHFEGRDEASALVKLATAGPVETTVSTPLDARVLDDADP